MRDWALCVVARQSDRLMFVRVAVPEFDPSAAAAAKQQARLLAAAEEHLGNLLAELYVALPSLAACGFKASFAKRPPATMLSSRVASRPAGGTQGQDATSVAVAAVAPAMGLDMQALRALVASTRDTLEQISR